MRRWPLVPGVPAAGHMTAGGFWHPGAVEGCQKCDLFRRTAPRWNCVDFEDGMHYVTADGECLWCGKTREQIAP